VAELPAEPVDDQGNALEIDIPVVMLQGVNVKVATQPDGARVLIVGPFALALPMLEEGARKIGTALCGGIVPVGNVDLSKLPKMDIPRGR
jgi:hypothetical protein